MVNWIAGGLGTWRADALINEIRLWDTETLETRLILLQPHGCIRPWALEFSPCGKYLVSGAWWKWGLDKAPIHLWEMSTGEKHPYILGTHIGCTRFSIFTRWKNFWQAAVMMALSYCGI